MKKTAIILLVMFMLLTAGCTDQKEPAPTVSETTPFATESVIPSETQVLLTEPATEPEETVPETEPVDISTTATPTESGKCRSCGEAEDDYDGYCYYCHPDFLFTCAGCGYEQPYHRPESGLCYDCEALDAVTGATPTESGKCRSCGEAEDDYDGYCYYCHPDFLFTCAGCGYEQPYHRPESGLCYDCAAAVDATTSATP